MPRQKGALARSTCSVCGVVHISRCSTNKGRCPNCTAQGLRNPSVGYRWTGTDEGCSRVSALIREGRLQHPTKLACVDCGKAAEQYDHRDYNKLEEVQPVCRGCNLRRGPAKPADGSLERLVATGWAPYRSRRATAKVLALTGRPVEILDGMPSRITVEHWRQILAAPIAVGPNPQRAPSGPALTGIGA